MPLDSGAGTVSVRRAVYAAAADRQPVQIHVSWLPGLGDDNTSGLRSLEPRCAVAGGGAAGHRAHYRLRAAEHPARGANPLEAVTFGIPDATTVLVSHLTTYD